MTAQTTSTPYSPEGLQALQEALSLHAEMAMIWQNPVTNQIAIKQLYEPKSSELPRPN